MFGWLASLLRPNKAEPEQPDLPIELEDHGFYGRVRQGGEPGHRLPDLIAHRPERWRFNLLADVTEQARALAANQLGEAQAAQMIDAIEYICDAKGDFTVLWRREGHRQDYETFVTRALHEMGEDEIVHEITVSPKA